MRGQHRPIRRLDHPRRLVVFLVGTVLVASVAFAVGLLVRSPDAAVLDARDASVPVFVSVEQRVVSPSVRLQGQVSGPVPSDVFVPAPEGASRAIVTSVRASVGALARVALLGTVSDRPVFVVATEIPLYRDLTTGSTGSDVASFQDALGLPRTGIVDAATLKGVRALYESNGFVAPGGSSRPMIPMAEFPSVRASGGMRLAAIASTGAELGPEVPFASVSAGAPFIAVRASVQESQGIHVGDRVDLRGSAGRSEEGGIESVSEFQRDPTPEGRPPGRDVRIAFDATSGLQPGDAVTVDLGGDEDETLAVPSVAIRSDGRGAYVLEGPTGKTVRVDVVVLRSSDGWSAITGDGLAVGDPVLIPG